MSHSKKRVNTPGQNSENSHNQVKSTNSGANDTQPANTKNCK